jgi:hypothetical protein
MILFIDTEWADAPARELVSLAVVSDCGRFEFYAERDPLPEKPSDFVRSVVYPLLERGLRALPDDKFTEQLHAFFESVLEVAPYGKVLVAFDYRKDLDLLIYALDGFGLPEKRPRPPFNAFNLGLLGIEYEQAVEDIFAADPQLRQRRHNARIDAWVNRDAYIALRDREAWELSELERLRESDPELQKLMVETLGNIKLAARWWTRPSRSLGNETPSKRCAEGKRADVVSELYAIKCSIPS